VTAVRSTGTLVLVAIAACKNPPARPAVGPADAANDAPVAAVARPPDAAVAHCGSSPGPELPLGRAVGAAAVLADGTILLGGPSKLGGWSAILDPDSGKMTDVVVPGASAAIHMVRTGDAIVMLGSPNAVAPATDAMRFDSGIGRWSKLPSVPACATVGPSAELDVTVEPVTLADGTVLVVGSHCAAILGTDGTWSETAPPVRERRGFTLVRLRDGDVLRIGGLVTTADGDLEASTVVDRYHVAKGRWSAAAPAHYMRYDQSAVRLDDGRVLVVGGCEDSGTICHAESKPAPPPEIYDPARDRWTVLGSGAVTNRESAALTSLPDGRVVVLGGLADDRGTIPPSAVYDHGHWFALPPLAQDRVGRVAVVAGDHVLLSGRFTRADQPVLEWYGVAVDCPATPVDLQPAPPPVGGSYP